MAEPNLTRLGAAVGRIEGLELVVARPTQREPEAVVTVREEGDFGSLIQGRSQDSVDTAAMYVVQNLERLGPLVAAVTRTG